jgi:hypothetical protein
VSYSNRPFIIGGNEQADQNQVQISVNATFTYTSEEDELWRKDFAGTFTYDPVEDPVNGEESAAEEALQQIANNMFSDAVSSW